MLLDIGVGILIAIGVSKLFALPLTLFFVASGIFFSLLVDADALINLIRYRGIGKSYKHRDLFHIPLLYIPIGMIIVFIVSSMSDIGNTSSTALSILFGLCSLAHFIHDSIGIGWGVKWLAPFSSDQYSFFYQYNAYQAGLASKHGVYVWKHGEIDTLEKKYGDKDWFRKIYLRFHPYGMLELLVFAIAVILLFRTQ